MFARILSMVLAGGLLAAAGEPPPLAERLAKADVQRGEGIVRKQCAAACHTYDKGGAARVGPNLWDIVGRPIANREGYRYSRALKQRGAEGGVWTYEALDAYLAAPRKFVPATSMTFVGLSKPQARADVILYLRALSDDPHPLPEKP
jgi:cytochrome c